jgi:hypothetical protein
MKKIIYTLSIVLGLGLNANAQIQSLAGPRIGTVFITESPVSTFLNGKLTLEDLGELPANYDEIKKGNLTTLYGWQWESRFADAGNVTGIVEWVALVAGMENGKFLPSVSSLVGARTESGLEFAIGPNLSLGGIAMVFGVGYNFKSGNLNMPVNFAFVPGKKNTQEIEAEYEHEWVSGYYDNEGNYIDGYEIETLIYPAYTVDYNTGNRFSITVGFNLTK